MPTALIGKRKEKFPPLKTRECVDHAGPSPPPVPLKLKMPSTDQDPSPPDLNKNWLTAQEATEIWDATVVLWTMPSNISLTLVSPLKTNMLTKPLTDHANPDLPTNCPSLNSPMLTRETVMI